MRDFVAEDEKAPKDQEVQGKASRTDPHRAVTRRNFGEGKS